MSKQKVYYFKKDLRNVTEYYYGIILKGLNRASIKTVEIDNFSRKKSPGIPKEDYLLVTELVDFFVLYLRGYRHFIYWFQGITPEEHYLNKHSRWKYRLYSYMEKLALKKVEYKIGVSKYLFEHYNRKYHLNISLPDVFIMPCYNSELQKDNFYIANKYEENVFCYAGGVQKWQGFEDILEIYNRIEEKNDNVLLKVFSKDLDYAKTLLNEQGIKNYQVDCLPQSEVDKALSKCKFGFIIREDDVINNVATPTKLATYIGNGVIPIITKSIFSFRDLSNKYKYICCLRDKNDIDPIVELLEAKYDPDGVFEEFSKVFEDYYNTEKYINMLSKYFA